jgi:hypothetical protein
LFVFAFCSSHLISEIRTIISANDNQDVISLLDEKEKFVQVEKIIKSLKIALTGG